MRCPRPPRSRPRSRRSSRLRRRRCRRRDHLERPEARVGDHRDHLGTAGGVEPEHRGHPCAGGDTIVYSGKHPHSLGKYPLILGHEGYRPFYLLGQAALWVVVALSVVSAVDYYRKYARATAS